MRKSVIWQALLVLALVMVSAASAWADGLTPKLDEKKGKWGYVDASGKWEIKPKFDSAEPFVYGMGKVAKSGKWGVVNEAGKLRLPCEYELIYCLDNGLAYGSKTDTYDWTIYNKVTDKTTDLTDVNFEEYGENISIVGRVEYCFVLKIQDPLFGITFSKDGKVTQNGITIIERLNDNILCIGNGQRVDLYTRDGKFLLSTRPSSISKAGGMFKLGNDMWMTQDGLVLEKQGSIGGKVILKVMKTDGKTGVFDPSTNKFIIPLEYDYIGYETDDYGNVKGDGMLYLYKDSLWGATQVNSNNPIRLPLRYKNRYEDANMEIAKRKPLEYVDEINGFWLKEGDRFGLIDVKGETLIPCEYSRIGFLGMQKSDYLLYKDTAVGLYDVNAKRFIVPIGKYDEYYVWNEKYHEKVYIVVKNSKYGLISLDGKEIVPCKYKDITQGASTATTPRFYHVWMTDKSFGLCNDQGKLIAPVGAVDKVVEARSEILVVSKNNKKGAISYNGTTLVPMKHQRFEGCGMEGRMCFSDDTVTGSTLYVYTKNGQLLTSKSFDRSERWAVTVFLKNYMNVVL